MIRVLKGIKSEKGTSCAILKPNSPSDSEQGSISLSVASTGNDIEHCSHLSMLASTFDAHL